MESLGSDCSGCRNGRARAVQKGGRKESARERKRERRSSYGRLRNEAKKRTKERVLRDCEHGDPAANASYPRLGGAYAA